MTRPTLKRPAFTVWAAVPIILIAFALRVWRLGSQSFWWDESYSTMVASESLRSIVATLAREDFHPPLHYFILHYWMRIAGQSEFALRFASVAAGTLTIAVAWIAAKRLLSRSAAPIAAAIFALSPFLWYYSQEARMFALVPLFGLLTVYFCARAVENSNRGAWLAYVAATALGLYSLYYAIFMPFVCGLWIVLRGGRRGPAFRGWAIATFAAFVMYAPWAPIFLSRSEVWSSAFQPENGPIKVVTWSWPEFVMGLPNLALYRQDVPLAMLGLATLVAIGALGYVVRMARRRPGLLLAALSFVVPLVTIAAISAVKPVFHPRYAIPVVAGLYLAFAALIDVLFVRGWPTSIPRADSSRRARRVRGSPLHW
ncbi:MAG: glycosyltransferase family 39 protein, partial [Candidatus Dormibacteraceae bacterium]